MSFLPYHTIHLPYQHQVLLSAVFQATHHTTPFRYHYLGTMGLKYSILAGGVDKYNAETKTFHSETIIHHSITSFNHLLESFSLYCIGSEVHLYRKRPPYSGSDC